VLERERQDTRLAAKLKRFPPNQVVADCAAVQKFRAK